MRHRLITGLLAGLLAVSGAACDDTVGGVEEDVEEGTDEIEQELDES